MRSDQDKNHFAIDIFDRHAAEYEAKFMDLSRYAEGLDEFCGAVPKGHGSVLDLACGPGNVSRYLLHRRPDLDLLGIDLAPAMLDIARRNCPGAEFRQMDCRAISGLEARFGGIIGGFVLPYLSPAEVADLVRDAAALLAPGGVLYLSAMEGKPSDSGWKGPSSGGPERLYTYYHRAEDLVAALQANGLERIRLHRLEYEGPDGMAKKEFVLLAKA